MSDSVVSPGLQRPQGDTRPTAVGNRVNDEKNRRLKEACSEFEALFISQLLKELRASVGKDGLMDGGRAEDVFTGMMDTELARDLAAKGGIGLAAMLYRQLESARADRPPETGSAEPADSETASRHRQGFERIGDAKVSAPDADKPNEALSANAGVSESKRPLVR